MVSHDAVSNDDEAFGFHAIMTIRSCDPAAMTRQSVMQFLEEFVDTIGMKVHATNQLHPQAERYGYTDAVRGVTGFYPIEESGISIHCVDRSKTAYLDIFSCKFFDFKTAVNFARKNFGSSARVTHSMFLVR